METQLLGPRAADHAQGLLWDTGILAQIKLAAGGNTKYLAKITLNATICGYNDLHVASTDCSTAMTHNAV